MTMMSLMATFCNIKVEAAPRHRLWLRKVRGANSKPVVIWSRCLANVPQERNQPFSCATTRQPQVATHKLDHLPIANDDALRLAGKVFALGEEEHHEVARQVLLT